MQIVEVIQPNLEKEFLEFPARLYRKDPNYIRPLDNDINKVFDPNRNKYFAHGRAKRWLLTDNRGNTIGRVAAFVNEATAHKGEYPVGGMGFFDCIDDKTAAMRLFGICKKWLEQQGMEAMDGPINFGERNNWWGLLVEGFDEPCYGMNYNFPYYQNLFEEYGFQLYFNQLSFGLGVHDERPEKYMERSKELMKNPDYRFEHLRFNNLDKYTEDLRIIYNKSFVNSREGLKEMNQQQAQNLVKALKPVAVDYLCWFGYYKEEPIALFIMLPELNQYFKHVNGKLNLLGKLKYVYHKAIKSNKKIFGILFGVVPEFQGKGVEGGIIMAADEVVRSKNRWQEIELTWIGDFNPKMVRVAENLGAKVVKRHVTYRYLFDRNRPFERYPIVKPHV